MWINEALDYALLSVYLSPRFDVCFFPWVDAVLISYQISVMKAGFREFNWYYAEEKCLAQEQNEVLTELKAASHRPL